VATLKLCTEGLTGAVFRMIEPIFAKYFIFLSPSPINLILTQNHLLMAIGLPSLERSCNGRYDYFLRQRIKKRSTLRNNSKIKVFEKKKKLYSPI